MGRGFRLTKQDIKTFENKVYSLEVERVEPATTKKEWVYELKAPGLEEEELKELVQNHTAVISTSPTLDIVKPNVELKDVDLDPEPVYPPEKRKEYSVIMTHPRIVARWNAAVQAEEAAFKLEQMNQRAIDQRRKARHDMYQAVKQNTKRKEKEELNWLKEHQGTDEKVDKILKLRLIQDPSEKQRLIEQERYEMATRRLQELRESVGLKTLISIKQPSPPAEQGSSA
jgi:hypothetical protein